MRRAYEAGERVGWLTLGEAYAVTPKPGARSGLRWLCDCSCGATHDVSYENLRNGRVRACRKCAKAFRAQDDG